MTGTASAPAGARQAHPGTGSVTAAAAAVMLGLLAWHVWFIPHSGMTLFYDEAQYWDWSREPAWGYYSKPPLVAWLIGASTAVFGDSVLGVRLLIMLLYPLTALLIGRLAADLRPGSGPVAALIFISLPISGLLGLFATTDAPLLLTWALAAWALWRAQTTDRLRSWALLGVAAGLGLLAKYTAAAFALTALIALWAVPGPRRGLLRPGPWLAAAIALALIAPNLWWNAQMGFPTLQHTADITTRSSRGGGLAAALEFIAGQAAILGPVGAWYALAGVRRLRGASRAVARSIPAQGADRSAAHDAARDGAEHLPPGAAAYLLALTLPLLGVAVLQAFRASAHINWAAPAHVGSVLLAVVALMPAAGLRRRALAVLVGSNLALTLLVAHLPDLARASGATLPSRLDVFVRMRGWDRAFADLQTRLPELAQPGTIVLSDDRLLLTEAAYQWRALNVRPVAWNPEGGVRDHYELTTRFAPRPGQPIVLLARDGEPRHVLEHFARVERIPPAIIRVGPDRTAEVHAFRLGGWIGPPTAYGAAEPGAAGARVAAAR
ncbi:MAG: glycosyltransferase family 39 protein [Burkholderiales bacterium]|nr:glycosyltransferase family 39 protein [Burkholderiales bacterium]